MACGPEFDLLTRAEIGGETEVDECGWRWGAQIWARNGWTRPELAESGGSGEGGRGSVGGVGSVGDERRVVGERDIGRLPWAFFLLLFAFCFPISLFCLLI
jgi:hypothetical protein